MSKIELATNITSVTLVGVNTSKFPVSRGNCFSVNTESGKEYRIVNFSVENLEYGLKKKFIEWPIKILPLSDYVAVIHDERIDEAYFDNRYCEVCCPKDLLPPQQRLAHERAIACGARVEGERIISFNHQKLPVWKTKEQLEKEAQKRKENLAKYKFVLVEGVAVSGLDADTELTNILTKEILEKK